MAQQVKVTAIKPDHLSFMPGIHVVEKIDSFRLSSDLLHMSLVALPPKHTKYINSIKRYKYLLMCLSQADSWSSLAMQFDLLSKFQSVRDSIKTKQNKTKQPNQNSNKTISSEWQLKNWILTSGIYTCGSPLNICAHIKKKHFWGVVTQKV